MSINVNKRKVFCIGLGRTGTTTFGECCRILGLRHRTGPVGLGMGIYRIDEQQKIYELLIDFAHHWDALSDYPWPYLYEMLDECFPDALFVMTKRKSVEKWYESLCRHYDRTGPSEGKKLAYGYYTPYENPDAHKKLYEEHLSSARAYFNQSNKRYREFCWETGDGWSELCEFLGIEIPAASFPHENARDKPTDTEVVSKLLKNQKIAHAVYYSKHVATNKEECIETLINHTNNILQQQISDNNCAYQKMPFLTILKRRIQAFLKKLHCITRK